MIVVPKGIIIYQESKLGYPVVKPSPYIEQVTRVTQCNLLWN